MFKLRLFKESVEFGSGEAIYSSLVINLTNKTAETIYQVKPTLKLY